MTVRETIETAVREAARDQAVTMKEDGLTDAHDLAVDNALDSYGQYLESDIDPSEDPDRNELRPVAREVVDEVLGVEYEGLPFERTTAIDAEDYAETVEHLAHKAVEQLERSPDWIGPRGVSMDITSNHRYLEDSIMTTDVLQLAHNDSDHESHRDESDLRNEAWECLWRDVHETVERMGDSE